MRATPAKWNYRMGFSTLAGSGDAELQGEDIVGHWKPGASRFYGFRGHSLAEEFVNWADDPQSIIRFTRKFGPLNCPQQEDGEFRQSLQEWRAYQVAMRRYWRFLGDNKHYRGRGAWTSAVVNGEYLTALGGNLTFVTPHLAHFLLLELGSCSVTRLRICARPDCKTPHFTARHLRQHFCSEPCAQWGQRQWKKQWWTEHGQTWRKQRKSEEREDSHRGPRKTR